MPVSMDRLIGGFRYMKIDPEGASRAALNEAAHERRPPVRTQHLPFHRPCEERISEKYLGNKTQDCVTIVLDKLEWRYGARFSEILKTITVDNDCELLDREQLECISRSPSKS